MRSLGRQGLEVQAGWCDPQAAAARSVYLRVIHDLPGPSLQHLAWRDRLLDVLVREDVDLVVPCNDPAVLCLQAQRGDFAAFAGRVYLLDDRVFRVGFSKHESYELARSLGIAVPRRIRIASLAELREAAAALPLPVLVKPPASFTPDRLRSKHHVRWARTPVELERHVRALLPWGDVAVEERVPGRGVGVEVLAHEGRILVAFQHERLHEPAGGGGSSYRRSVPLHPELLSATARFLEALRYTGVAMMEFRLDPATGRWAFIEINARFWGSLPLALAAGVDFPFWLYQMWVEGRRDFPQGYPADVRCRNLLRDGLWTVRQRRARRLDPALVVPWWRVAADLGRLAAGRDHCDTFVRDDPGPGFAELTRVPRRLVRLAIEAAVRLAASLPLLRRLSARRAQRALREARRVLFVCKGNVCRSPFAHRRAAALLPPDVRVASCGYYPEPDRPCPPVAIEVADELGVDLRSHRSRVLSPELLEEADAVFVFDEDNYLTLRARHPGARRKLHFLGALGPARLPVIRDPSGGDHPDFRTAYRAIDRCLTAALAGDRAAPPGPPRARAAASAG